MIRRRLFSLLLLAIPAAAFSAQPAAVAPPRPIAVEVGTSANHRGGLLDILLAAPDDDAVAAERELRDSLSDRPWVQVVSDGGEAAVAVSRCNRVISSQSRSKDGKQTKIGFRYAVSAGIAIRGERGTIDAETLVTHTYSQSQGRRSPTRSEDRDAFRRAGGELARKAREWLLPRIAVLRPDGPDAGFLHRTRFRLLVKGDGLEVTEVAPGSPAERADLRVGDRIRRVDREDGTTQMNERVQTWRLEPAGTSVMLEVERNRQRNTIVLLLEPGGRRDVEPAVGRQRAGQSRAAERGSSSVGTASGSLTLNGKKVPLKYAYAMTQPNTFDPKKNDTAILLTEKPLADGALAGLEDLQDATHPLIRSGGHDGLAYFKINSSGKPIYELIDHPALKTGRYRQIQMSGFTHADFVPKKMERDRVDGTFATSKVEDFMTYKYEIAVEFSAPLVQATRR